MTIDEKVALWLKDNPDAEVQSLLDEYNERWYGFMKAEEQTYNVKQFLASYAKLKRVFHNKSNTDYF
jgi:hypothetical protein